MFHQFISSSESGTRRRSPRLEHTPHLGLVRLLRLFQLLRRGPLLTRNEWSQLLRRLPGLNFCRSFYFQYFRTLTFFNFWKVFLGTIAKKMKLISGDPCAQRLLLGHSPGIVAHHPGGRQGQVPLVAEVVGRMRDTVQSGWTFRGSCPTSWDSQTNLMFCFHSSF